MYNIRKNTRDIKYNHITLRYLFVTIQKERN